MQLKTARDHCSDIQTLERIRILQLIGDRAQNKKQIGIALGLTEYKVLEHLKFLERENLAVVAGVRGSTKYWAVTVNSRTWIDLMLKGLS